MKPPKARKLPSGSWFVQLRIDGKSISITRPTEKEAVAEAMAVKAGLKKPEEKAKPSKMTISKAIDAYIEARQNILSPSTIGGYRVIQKTRFKSLMPSLIADITSSDAQKAINLEAKICSAKTLCNAWGLVSAAIKDQTGNTYSVRLPQKIPNDKEFLDSAQIVQFMGAIQGDVAEVAALLALHSLRRSELLALTWDNVDMSHGIIHVRGSIVSDENGTMVLKKENKNASSRRDIPIMIPRLLEILESEPEKSGLVVVCTPNVIYKHINKACRSASLPEVGIHGLRHSFASLAYSIGMPEKESMMLGGWSDYQTMRKIYTHVSQRDMSKYQNMMAQFYAEIANKNANG